MVSDVIQVNKMAISNLKLKFNILTNYTTQLICEVNH